jgi:hypothetical protein
MEALNRLAGPPSARSAMVEVLLLAAAVSLFPLAQLRHSTPDLLLSGVPLLLMLGAGLHPPRGVSNSDLRERRFFNKQSCGSITFWQTRGTLQYIRLYCICVRIQIFNFNPVAPVSQKDALYVLLGPSTTLDKSLKLFSKLSL